MKKLFAVVMSLLVSLVAQPRSLQAATVASSITVTVVSTNSTSGLLATPWSTVLKTTISNTTEAASPAILAQVSMQTGIFTSDTRFFTVGPSLTSQFAQIQVRVLVDCFPPACISSSVIVPAANLATPGIVNMDGTTQFLVEASNSLRSQGFLGVHSYNFYQINPAPLDPHKLEVQARFSVDAVAFPAGFAFSNASAFIGPRTLIADVLPTITIDDSLLPVAP